MKKTFRNVKKIFSYAVLAITSILMIFIMLAHAAGTINHYWIPMIALFGAWFVGFLGLESN